MALKPPTFHAEKDRLGMSNAQLSEVLGVTERTIRRWLSGVHDPKSGIFVALKTLKPNQVRK